MRKILLLISIILLSSSCLTVKRIQRNCDQFAAVCITEKERETVTEYLDRIVYVDIPWRVKLPNDLVRLNIPLPCPSSINIDPVVKESGLVGAKAWVIDSKLYVEAYLTDSIFITRLQDSIVLLNAIKQITIKETNTVTVKEDTGFGKFAKRWFWGSVLIILSFGAFVLLKIKFKI